MSGQVCYYTDYTYTGSKTETRVTPEDLMAIVIARTRRGSEWTISMNDDGFIIAELRDKEDDK